MASQLYTPDTGLAYTDGSQHPWLFLVKIFFDPAVACCTLIRDSSLSLTQKISSAILPATSTTWMNKKKNQELENGSLEDFEMRVTDLEAQMTIFKTVFIRDT